MSGPTAIVSTQTTRSAGRCDGFGMPEMHAGLEQCMNWHLSGMDAVEFRRRNCLKTDSILATGGKMHPTGLMNASRSRRGNRLGPESSAHCA